LKLADALYVTGNIFENPETRNLLDSLPGSCYESAQILLQKRGLYEREGVFPDSIINYVADLLEAEDDATIHAQLNELRTNERSDKIREIMHRDLHTISPVKELFTGKTSLTK
jgi:glutamine synthetase